MSQPILFSVIIANYNKADNISALLTSVCAEHSLADFEVFFMDDASTDKSVEIAGKFPVNIRCSEGRVGPATLRNMAAREARGKYLLFVDSDAILPEGTIQRFRELCLTGGFGAVSGLEVLPPVIDNWIGWFRTLQVQDYFGEHRLAEGTIDAWGATLGGVRRELFLRVGGFNESYRGADVEDHELAVRMRGEEPMFFSPLMTYRHSYPGTLELIIKQFRRAFMIVQFENDTMLKSSLLFRWRFKGGHILATSIVAVGLAAPFKNGFVYLFLPLLLLKICLNWHLFSQAFRVKGPLFMAYALFMSLITGVSIVLGALFGKVQQLLR